ncbi:enhancer of mRNA decapping [Hypoxylon texense]
MSAPALDTAGEQPWADSPIQLVTTPQYETKKTDIFTTGATHMALLHNAILRGYNSIYQQAPHVKPGDKYDFIGYALTWHKFVATHHDDEEATLFPKVEEVLGDKGVWAATHQEHEAFLGGLAEFATYLRGVENKATEFSGEKLVQIMDGFREPFAAHFHSEIATIAGLASHPNAPKPGSPEEAQASATFKSWGKSTVTKAGTLDVVPFFLLNLDGTAEEGTWAGWPPIPAPIKWGLVNVAGAYHARRWKFSSCAGGRPRKLYAAQ